MTDLSIARLTQLCALAAFAATAGAAFNEPELWWYVPLPFLTWLLASVLFLRIQRRADDAPSDANADAD